MELSAGRAELSALQKEVHERDGKGAQVGDEHGDRGEICAENARRHKQQEGDPDADADHLLDEFNERVGKKSFVSPETSADHRIDGGARKPCKQDIEQIGAARIGKHPGELIAEEKQETVTGTLIRSVMSTAPVTADCSR